jgi:hypothetical protein
MSNRPDRTPPSIRAATAVSLVAIFAGALTSDASASRLPVDSKAADEELTACVRTIIARVRTSEPALLQQLVPKTKMAWSN